MDWSLCGGNARDRWLVMAVSSLLWKLASPYDAFVSHVSTLVEAIERIQHLSEMAVRYDAGLQGSVQVTSGGSAPEVRVQRFRERLGSAAASMSDEQFEDFISALGGGAAADVESNRAMTTSRRQSTQRGLEEYFGIAGRELALLEARGYNPTRADVARLLRENRLPPTNIPEFRRQLHDLGARVGIRAN